MCTSEKQSPKFGGIERSGTVSLVCNIQIGWNKRHSKAKTLFVTLIYVSFTLAFYLHQTRSLFRCTIFSQTPCMFGEKSIFYKLSPKTRIIITTIWLLLLFDCYYYYYYYYYSIENFSDSYRRDFEKRIMMTSDTVYTEQITYRPWLSKRVMWSL